MSNRTKFGGFFRAFDYAYGDGLPMPTLTVITAPAATGAGSVTLSSGIITLSDGTTANPLSTNAAVLVGSGSNQETVTPSAVQGSGNTAPGSAGFTATFSNLHGQGDPVASATFGLQEAINDANAKGGGVVLVDYAWAKAGGTTAMISAATLPGGNLVSITDNRTAGGAAAVGYTTYHARYSFATDGGVTGLITPAFNITIPQKFVIMNCSLNSTTAVTSGGSATVSVGLSAGAGGAAALVAATAKASWSANAFVQAIPVPQTASTWIKMSAAGTVTITVGTADLTAGVIEIYLFGYLSAT